MNALLLASGNPGKIKELHTRLAGTGVRVMGLRDLPEVPEEIPENGETFRANAILKAVGYGQISGMPALADDSGLAVDALDGAPGVYSARYSGEHANDASNNALLLKQLGALPDAPRTARFCCAIALYLPPNHALTSPLLTIAREAALDVLPADDSGWIVLADGEATGRILTEACGEGGFGYDPLFLSDDLDVTFAEASSASKLKVSHRGRALDTLEPLWQHLRDEK